jgi:hypothetical protein
MSNLEEKSNEEIYEEFIGDQNPDIFLKDLDSLKDLEAYIREYVNETPNMFGKKISEEDKEIVIEKLKDYLIDFMQNT